MSPDEIEGLARGGWIPAPHETEAGFLTRIEQGKKTTAHLGKGETQPALLKEGSEITQKLFGFSIDWVPVLFSNRKLSFFEGAAAWIFQETIGAPEEAFLQLRKGLKGKKYLLGYYPREELVAHELVHVSRMAFTEPLFEEMLAYETTSSPFRKVYGPLFRQPKEAYFFLISLVLPLFGTLIPYLWTIPCFVLLFFAIRLSIHRRAFNRKKREIEEKIEEKNRGLFLLALSDGEILEKGIHPPPGNLPRDLLLRHFLRDKS